MKQKIISALISLLIIGYIVFNIFNQEDPIYKKTYFYLGTVIEITLFDEDDQKHFDTIEAMISEYDLQFDRNNTSSEIYKINHQLSNQVSPSSEALIETAFYYSDLCSGYFDITINPIVELWGFGSDETQVPSDISIQNALVHVGYKNIVLENGFIELNNTTLDLGAIAKGFIADEISEYLKSQKVDKALINLGGNVYALGSNTNNQPWAIGIRHPYEAGAILKIDASNQSIVTSGITERFFEEDGQMYHHIFNPYTGYPVDNELVSLTVISDHSIQGDALSTGLFTLGIEEAFRIAELENVQLIIITKDKSIYTSEGLQVELYDDSYTIK